MHGLLNPIGIVVAGVAAGFLTIRCAELNAFAGARVEKQQTLTVLISGEAL
jgi:hypothetical protein